MNSIRCHHEIPALSWEFTHDPESGSLVAISVDGRRITVEPIPASDEVPAELREGGAVMILAGNKIRHRNIPAEFLPYVCLHEATCPIASPSTSPHERCADAVMSELEAVPPNLRTAYVAWRKTFFAGMVRYAESKMNGEHATYFVRLAESMRESHGMLATYGKTSGTEDPIARTKAAVESLPSA